MPGRARTSLVIALALCASLAAIAAVPRDWSYASETTEEQLANIKHIPGYGTWKKEGSQWVQLTKGKSQLTPKAGSKVQRARVRKNERGRTEPKRRKETRKRAWKKKEPKQQAELGDENPSAWNHPSAPAKDSGEFTETPRAWAHPTASNMDGTQPLARAWAHPTAAQAASSAQTIGVGGNYIEYAHPGVPSTIVNPVPPEPNAFDVVSTAERSIGEAPQAPVASAQVLSMPNTVAMPASPEVNAFAITAHYADQPSRLTSIEGIPSTSIYDPSVARTAANLDLQAIDPNTNDGAGVSAPQLILSSPQLAPEQAYSPPAVYTVPVPFLPATQAQKDEATSTWKTLFGKMTTG